MKRFSFILVFLCLFMICAPVFSLAESNPNPVVDSVMTEPDCYYSSDTLCYYIEGYNPSNLSYRVSVISISLDNPDSLCLVSKYASSQFYSQSPFSGTVLTFDASTGYLIKSYVFSSSSYSRTFNGVTYPYGRMFDFPGDGGYNNNPFYCIPSSSLIAFEDWNYAYNSSFINWAPVVPSVHTYSSYLSEPIADPYNRYIVLAGDDHQYIFLLSFSLSDLTLFNSQSVNQGVDEVDLTYNNVFTPVLKLDNNQLKLELNIDPQIFYILNNTDDHLYKYNLMFAKYNLVDGQYISSSLYSGSITSATTSLAFDFGSYNDYDSIKTYGVQYIDELTSQWHYNLLHCSWGHDPEFEAWQDDVLFYLQGIYDSLVDNGASEELTTDPAVQAGVDEYVSDEAHFMDEMESGESQVDIIFEDASSQFATNGNGFAFVKEVFEDFIIGFPLPYTIIFMSLVFGFVLVVIGRKVSKS